MTDPSLIIKKWPTGSGFPLPSLDAESLAVIAYFNFLSSTRDHDTCKVRHEPAWDASISPNGRLPMLHCICEKEFGGAAGIFRHLRQCSAIESHADLDSWMNDDELADCVAWSSLLVSRATTLLDLYLYLTPENYPTTRSAFTTFLPLYANYTIPPALYKAAESRSSHLSVVSILASGNADTETSNAALGSGAGKLGFGNSRSASDMNAGKAGRRLGLENAVSALFAPLEELLGTKKYFFDETRPSSFDALVLGYLAVIHKAEMPDQWAKEILESRYPKLIEWIERNLGEVFDIDSVAVPRKTNQ